MQECILRHLGGDLRRIAELAGLEAALRMGRVFGGTSLYIQDLSSLERAIRDERMLRARRRGRPIRVIASAFNLSERRVAEILRSPAQGPAPEPELVEMMDRIEAEMARRSVERIWEGPEMKAREG